MTWLAWMRRPWIVLGMSLSLMLAVAWAGSVAWAVTRYGTGGTGVIVWKGSVTYWWPPGGNHYSPASGAWRLRRNDQPMMLWWPRWHDDGRTAWVTVPLWMPLLLVAAPSLWFARSSVHYPGGCCQHCGYNLRGVPGPEEAAQCPECGGSPQTLAPWWLPAPRRIAWIAGVSFSVTVLLAQSLWTNLTLYAGCDASQSEYAAGPQLSLCNGGLLWRSSVLAALPRSIFVDEDSAPEPPGYTGPSPVASWTLSPGTFWWTKPFFDERTFSVAFFPGWLFVVAAAAIAWLLAVLLPRRIPPAHKLSAP